MFIYLLCFFFFFFNDTATTEIYTLSLHDALPISHILPRKTEWGLAARRYREPRRVDRRGARRPAPASGRCPAAPAGGPASPKGGCVRDRKSTRLNSSHLVISYAVFWLKKKRM